MELNGNMGIMPMKAELALEQSQQGASDDVLNIRVILFSIYSDDGNPSSVNVKQHCDDDYVYDLACLRDMIPSFDFSGFTSKDTNPSISQQILASVIFSEMIKDMRAGIFAKKEALVNFLTDASDGRSTLEPTDVLVFGWVEGKHECMDLTGVSPLVGLSSRGFTAGQAASKVASCKVTKHEKTCIANQYVFIPFAFDTFGFFAHEAAELLSRVQRVMHNNVMTPRSTDVVFKRIDFAIQKELAAHLVARLPSTT
ncbi:hypothetical protein Tco_1197520, partial [Tanacetum coccineum]